MGLHVKKLHPNDYEDILVGWWNDWGWEPPTRDFLPDDGAGGLIVYDGDIPVCAGFLYITNSKASWVDWIISSKSYRKKPERSIALQMLIESLTNVAQKTGSKFAYALIKHNGLIEKYESLGYMRGDNYNQEMIKAL